MFGNLLNRICFKAEIYKTLAKTGTQNYYIKNSVFYECEICGGVSKLMQHILTSDEQKICRAISVTFKLFPTCNQFW